MAGPNYTTLIASSSTAGSIANWLNSSQLVNGAPTIVAESESQIYRRLRHWRMIPPQATGVLSVSNQFLAQPADYLEVKVLYITGVNYQKLTMKTAEEVMASYSYDGNGNPVPQQPSIFYSDQVNFNFDTLPDQAYPYSLLYYQQPAPLATSITNFLTAYYPRMLRCSLMIGAAEFMKDIGQGNIDRSYWVNEFEKELMDAQEESDRQARATEAGMVLTGGDGGGGMLWPGPY